MENEFDDSLIVADQLRVFAEAKCKRNVVIKQMKFKYNQKDAMIFKGTDLVAIVECKRRHRIYTSWILELPKVMHWYNNYRDQDFIYLNRHPLGDYYINVKELGLEKYIEDGTIKQLDGSDGIEYECGSRLDRGMSSDYNRDWLKISNRFFKKIK